MRDDDTSIRALIAGYRAHERPSAATAAKIRRSLELAEREAPPARRRSAAPVLALAAALVLALAWRAGSAPRPVPRDRDAASAYTVDPAPATSARPRTGPADAPTVPSPAPLEPAVAAPPGRAATPGKRRKPAPPPDAGDRVLAEMAALQRAREALRGQRPDEALALLDEHARTWPRGDFTEEREALRVTALCAAGESSTGLAARATFLRAYPRSAYAGRVAAACEDSIDPPSP